MPCVMCAVLCCFFAWLGFGGLGCCLRYLLDWLFGCAVLCCAVLCCAIGLGCEGRWYSGWVSCNYLVEVGEVCSVWV
ncbi:hypothetical protein BO82DRAFT_57446 [Aspergillus uvarum CBS 121591]|uniref:Uncharacterized protein n=1 Tax=Aspergillus uvarum CBS 121591 TaxID=1448315 RepID=A0A319CBB8_9EURO|nr:hypothetical protein BO82DRAFT_57446 [Aspergillus uvarum CBS 121591]PYH82825.1 hypothetical protein BO82DRAFT_57446 [Aspergillus uvarum CBS 121591]